METRLMPHEKRWILIFGLVVMTLTTLPYLLGYARQGSTWTFTGTVLGVEDENTYLSDMVSGSAGAWLFQTPYTPYPQQSSPIFLPYILLGKLAAGVGLHEQVAALFHIFRFLAGMALIWATYDFLALFVRSVRWRRFGTFLATLGGGLGYLILLSGKSTWFGSLPVEFYSPEAFGFIMVYSIPHLALARALMLWGLRAFLLAAEKTGRARVLASLGAGGLWLLAALAQPLTGMIAGAVPVTYVALTGGWQAWRTFHHQPAEWQRWRSTLIAGLLAGCVAGPLAVYNALSFQLNPVLKAWNAQSAIPAANPVLYLLAYGLILPFSVLGALRLARAMSWQAVFLGGWAICFTAAMYIPFALQRRLIDGVWVALVTLAVLGLEQAETGWLSRHSLRWVPGALLGLSLPATLLLWLGGLLTAYRPAAPAFIPATEAQAFVALGKLAPVNAVVLSAPGTGNPLPAWAPVRVVVGIATLSVNYDSLLPQVKEFFTPGTPEATRQALLNTLGVNYVFWGPAERAMGKWDPRLARYLKPVYTQGDYMILQYQPVG